MTHISIPVAVSLASESNWEQLDDSSKVFGIVRFHFFLDDRVREGRIEYGQALGVYRKPKGVTIRRTESETSTIESIESSKTIENYLAHREELRELAGEILMGSSTLELFTFSGGVREKVSKRLKTTYSLGEEMSSSLRSTATETVTVENMLEAELEESIVSVPAYRRREVHLHLTHIDYLRVHYRRSMFGLRTKARSEPPVVDFRRHPNRIDVGQHLATFLYWELLPRSCCFLLEAEHVASVKDPTEVRVCPPEKGRDKRVEFPKVPTLYQLARAAFPRKWIWRKCEQATWTEEELMAIELDEVRDGMGWWQKHGPGSRRS